MPDHRYIAADLGAESGRVVAGTLSAGGRLTVDELHRFPSAAVSLPTPAGPSLRWDVLRTFDEVRTGLRRAATAGPADSVSVDSWGVDYAVVGGGHPALWPPFHYRDDRTAEVSRRVRDALGDAFIFGQTGVQFLPFNTLYQLSADADACRPLLDAADRFLTIADHLNWLLSGVPAVDQTNASTTQLYDPRTRQWAWPLVDRAGLPRHLFPTIVPPGTVLGPLAVDCGFDVPPAVIATCSHDTAAAVAAVPAEAGDDWAYISSGTWSLLGVELPEPLITDAARRANFTNEAGFGGTTRLLKNIVGLFVLQELRRAWAARGVELSYAELTARAAEAEPFRSVVRMDDGRFATPGDMPANVAAYCRETGQAVPESAGQFARCVLEGLAVLYRSTLAEVESLTGRTVRRLHVVGGGSRSHLLNQMTADATGRTVIAGPAEATAIGNLLVQAVALGHLSTLADVRRVVRDSFPTTTYHPSGDPRWAAAADRFARGAA